MIYAIVAVLVLILDQAVKYWTVSNITLEIGRVPLIDGLVHLTHVRNYGAAFSILQNTRWLLVALTIVFVAAIIYALCADLIQGAFGRWTALLLLAGAIGNGIDRLFVGYVVDMIEVEFISFPVFNVADIFVTVFGVLFCVYIVFHRGSRDERATERSISREVKSIWEQEGNGQQSAPARTEDDFRKAFQEQLRDDDLDDDRADDPDDRRVAPWQIPTFHDSAFAEWEKSEGSAKPAEAPLEKLEMPAEKPASRRPAAQTRPLSLFDEEDAPAPAVKIPELRMESKAPAPRAETKPLVLDGLEPRPEVKAKAPLLDIPGLKTEAKAPAEPKAEPYIAPAPKTQPADDMEFDLESILAEFKD